MTSQRPMIMGTHHMISSGHYHATMAGLAVLEAGGNAVDAGVAAGIALSVVDSTFVSFAGVAPIAIRMADRGEVVTISGLGCWPRAASATLFRDHHGGNIPRGILRTVVPAAPDAWITALQEYGTMSFGDVAAAAIRLARDGFPMYPFMAGVIEAGQKELSDWPSNAAVFLPGGRPPRVGEIFRQTALAATLHHMADVERASARHGRRAALDAVRDCFYRGDIARTMLDFHKANGGLLAAEDLAGFRVKIEPAWRVRFQDIDVYGCGPWCQGPMLLQQLAILDGCNLKDMGHNSVAYVHTVTEAIKLAAADREAFYGDPDFVDVPMERLLSPGYAAERRRLIDPARAFADLPPAGKPGDRPIELDTNYVCVVDRYGNAFSGTPSDSAVAGPLVPDLGFVVSPRGSQSWTDPAHPSALMPGKRPRLTPNPAIAIRPGSFVMPFGTPGHDSQTQVMLQAFLNSFVFGMDLQEAVEAPRICSLSFPSSASPHASFPGRLMVEAPLHAEIGVALDAMGHRSEEYPTSGPDYLQNSSAACAVMLDLQSGLMSGAADRRRPAYAAGR